MENEDLTQLGMGFIEESPFPHVSKSLVERLNVLYPNRCPEITDPDRLIWIKSGQRSVIEFLRSRHEEQTDNGKNRDVF